MHTVYGLVDPTSNMISYIGITSNALLRRLVQHLQVSTGDSGSPKGVWLNNLIENGYIPAAVVLQTVETEQQAQIAERWWIAQGQMLGWPLYNSMHFVPKQQKAKVSAKNVQRTCQPIAVDSIVPDDSIDEFLHTLFTKDGAIGKDGLINIRLPWGARCNGSRISKERATKMLNLTPALFEPVGGEGGRYRVNLNIASNIDEVYAWLRTATDRVPVEKT